MCESCEEKLVPMKVQGHDFPTILNSLTRETPSKIKSSEIRLVFECKLHTLLKMLSKGRAAPLRCQAVGGQTRPAWLPVRPAVKHGYLVSTRVSCSLLFKARRKRKGRDKGGCACGSSSQRSHSHPTGQNWSQDDFPPVKKSAEQNEEKEGGNHRGGHLLPHLHPQSQEVLCNSVNLAMVVWLRMPP